MAWIKALELSYSLINIIGEDGDPHVTIQISQQGGIQCRLAFQEDYFRRFPASAR
jgi:hypothetical protein